MTLAPGAQLGPYTITGELGRGGMGVVCTAHDPRLDRSVAIKVLPPDLTRDETAKQRFLQEAKAASALDHPNICTIYEINETADGQLYLVMAYYEGKTLKERIERGPLVLDDAIDIATQVGQGLAEAHGAGIVHRDIKPANLLIAKGGVVKILDFGLAKLAGIEGVTQTGTTVGTVAYMSPEQARGEEVDHRTDIWSLGVVLYEMLTGEPPFRGDNLFTLAEAIRSSEPIPLTGAAVSLSETLARALNKDASARYPAVGDLLADLTREPDPSPTTETTSTPALPSIAVLPFADMSPQRDQDYFCEGMAEEIINALTKLPGLKVVSRTSSFRFQGQSQDIRQVGALLNVEAILEGSVRTAGNRLRVTAQLINIADGYHLWSERYNRQLEDVFDIQDETAAAIVAALRPRLAVHIVQPATVIAWHRRGWRLYWRWKSRSRRPGRPRIPRAVQALIRQMCLVNPTWGAPRIHGELLKLGIQIAESTVGQYLVRRRRPPSQTWRTFLANHVGQLVAVDFFVVPTLTYRVLFVFVVLAHDRRRIVHVNVTEQPTAAWTAQQFRNAFPWDTAPRYPCGIEMGSTGVPSGPVSTRWEPRKC